MEVRKQLMNINEALSGKLDNLQKDYRQVHDDMKRWLEFINTKET